jgi:hypothetical protein
MNAHRAAAATEATQDPEGGNRHARAWRAVVTCIHAGSIDRSGRAGIGKAVCDALNQGRGNPRLAQRMRYLRHSGPQRSWSQTRCDRSAGGSRARQATGSTVAAGAMVIGIGQAASSATMGRQGRKARARSFQMEALGLPSRNVNLALNLRSRAGFTLQPRRCIRGDVIQSEAILL